MQANPVYADVTLALGFSLETIVAGRTTPLPRVKPMTKRARHKLAQTQNRIMAEAAGQK